jgi:hypothetical protein
MVSALGYPGFAYMNPQRERGIQPRFFLKLWRADYKGEFRLGNKKYCYPLTVTDHASRFLFLCEALDEFLRFAWQGSKLRRRDTAFGSRFVGRGYLQNDIFFSWLRSKNEGEGQTGRR